MFCKNIFIWFVTWNENKLWRKMILKTIKSDLHSTFENWECNIDDIGKQKSIMTWTYLKNQIRWYWYTYTSQWKKPSGRGCFSYGFRIVKMFIKRITNLDHTYLISLLICFKCFVKFFSKNFSFTHKNHSRILSITIIFNFPIFK